MPDAVDRDVDKILGRSLLAAETFASEFRARIAQRLASVGIRQISAELSTGAASLWGDVQRTIGQVLVDADMAAGIAGVAEVVDSMPGFAQELLGAATLPPPRPPTGYVAMLTAGGGDEPIIRFPVIEGAAEDLVARNIVTRAQFDAMAGAAREQAFTVAGDITEDTIGTIRDVLAETVREGASQRRFEEKMGEALEGSFLGPAHIETVYRTNIQGAFTRAHDQLADAPIVREVFPYAEYLPIHDARTRDEHLALEKLGLSGTGVYRVDDPFWLVFRIPWAYS